MKTVVKIIALLFTILFVWAAYVQHNDPDALMWYGIYGIAALASLLYVFGKLPYYVALLLFIAYLVGVVAFWPSEFEGVSLGTGDINNIEQGRESLGLLINALVMLIYAWQLKGSKR